MKHNKIVKILLVECMKSWNCNLPCGLFSGIWNFSTNISERPVPFS